jgi:hypothetical protein
MMRRALTPSCVARSAAVQLDLFRNATPSLLRRSTGKMPSQVSAGDQQYVQIQRNPAARHMNASHRPAHLQDKMLFGSDWPVITPDRWLSDFAKLEIRDEIRPKVLKANARRLLGI